jgi:predicted regulator of Ras-like GTPase activity (Roadblock/LC7/MglB family)
MGDNGVGATAPPQATDEQQVEDSNNNLVELQETVSRISAHKGIESVVIWKKGGDIVYSSQQPQGDSAKKAAAAQRLLQAAEDYFSGANDDDDTSATTTGAVSFVQVKTTSGKELLISPDQGFVLAVAKR